MYLLLLLHKYAGDDGCCDQLELVWGYITVAEKVEKDYFGATTIETPVTALKQILPA